MLRKWEKLPDFMKTTEVRPYWEYLSKKQVQLLFKRIVDIFIALLLLILLAIPMLIIAVVIKCDSPGSVFFRQERVTKYGKHFRIHKFRTMVSGADKLGSTVTVNGDSRITRIGNKIRRLRLDELPQIIDVIQGNMSFIGTRPEVPKYVDRYKKEYYATLLLPAGITSETSIRFKDEAKLLNDNCSIDDYYLSVILPSKMALNLKSIKEFSIPRDILTAFRTFLTILGKEYK